ncbi:MAG: nucleotidyltransferase domain-containing protein [Cyanobacteria bacterium M_surface_7_m2_037]|jgi:predicted nucleotidyltransferase|nr:nucleotidyltransferase domain-containing protein [Cyanobacteria bacterium M_surface_7_m2_037]MBM5820091.1 nucleotidyltransferase domain-containing protein [Cyanobacteria bacterium K_DeepCast_150m_m2_101]
MSTTPNTRAVDPRILEMAEQIQQWIPGAEIRLFGSRAKGNHRADSDIDLLVTAPDSWCQTNDRFIQMGLLWRALARHHLPIDLLIYSQSEVQERMALSSSVARQAYDSGIALHDQP